MKKMFFLAAGFAALLMTACGGEKKEDAKDAKKEITEETLKLVDEVKTNYDALNVELITLADGISRKGELTASSNLDSIKLLVEKWPKDKKAEGLAMMDTLAADKAKIEETESRFNTEYFDWSSATKMKTELAEAIDKKSIDGQEAEERSKSLAALMDSFRSSVDELKAAWTKIVANDEKFKAMNQ